MPGVRKLNRKHFGYQCETEHAVRNPGAELGRRGVGLVEMNGVVVARSVGIGVHTVLRYQPLKSYERIADCSFGFTLVH